jgi:hypothetical protein
MSTLARNRHAWPGRAVAWLALACAAPVARAKDQDPPQQGAAAAEAARLLRAGMKALGAAVPDGATAEEQAVARANEQAVLKQRKEQIDQLAAHFEQFLQPRLQAELELARRTCGGLPAEARGRVLAAGRESLKLAARQVAERQMGGEARPAVDPAEVVQQAVARELKRHAAEEEFAAYEREQAARVARRARMSRVRIVDMIDVQLELSQAQREAIAADLEKQWKDAWSRSLDGGNMRINDYRPAPDFADACIAPHLDSRQRAEWKKWCQQAGWNQRQLARQFNWGGHRHALQPDPWWTP